MMVVMFAAFSRGLLFVFFRWVLCFSALAVITNRTHQFGHARWAQRQVLKAVD